MDLVLAVCFGAIVLYIAIMAPELALSLGFATFIFSAQIRDHVDVSVSMLCAVFPIMAILGGFANRYRISIRKVDLLLALFTVIVLQSLRYSGSQEYGQIKAMQYMALAYLTVCATVYVVNTYQRLLTTLKAIRWTLLLYLLISASQYATGSAHIVDDRLAGLSDPIVSGRMYILCVLLVVYWWRTQGVSGSIANWSVTLVALALAFASGTRTVVIALVTTVVIVAIIRARSVRDLLGRGRLAAAAAVVLVAIMFTVLTPESISRFLPSSVQKRFGSVYALAGVDQLEEKGARLEYYTAAYDVACQSPIYGVGLGGFKDRSSHLMSVNTDPRAPVYPHNIVAEITCEQGVVGLAVFLAIIIFACRRILWLRTCLPFADPIRQRVILTVLAVFLFGLLTAQTSLDMPRQVILWWGFGLLMSLDRIMRRDSVTHYDKGKCDHPGLQPCPYDNAGHTERARAV